LRVALIDDLTKLRQLEWGLRQAEKMAAVGQLAAGIAHEINNPMGFITSNLSSLQRYFSQLFQLITLYEKSELDPVNPHWLKQIQCKRR
jgi:phosphoglycerate-specific signal transduction histidine kinase